MVYEFSHQITNKKFKIDINNKHVEDGMKNKGQWFYEQPMLDWMYKFYGKGGVFIDVGAWIGTHTLYFSKVMEAERVYAFEPVDFHRKNFIRNMEINGVENVTLLPMGLSDKETVMTYNLKKARVNPCSVVLGEPGEDSCVVTTLDSFEIKDVKVIKIDVEGMEENVIRGGEQTIKKYKPDLFVELVGNLDPVTNLLKEWGYERKEKFNATPTYRFTAL